jgi:F-type H+-transporting ATPase subunit a
VGDSAGAEAAAPVICGAPLPGVVGAFEPPTTKDFVWGCWGGSVTILGVPFCINFIVFLLLLSVAAFLILFYVAFRNPQIVPGKLQTLLETGIEFVREQISVPMIGSQGDVFLPLLATLFFFILLGNLLEVIPGINFTQNSRIAFPISMAVVSWVTYNVVGIRKHGFIGYLKLVTVPPGAPWWLRPLLAVIEFFTTIVIRPITLSLRLAANFLAGHFLLAVAFLGTIAVLQSGWLAVLSPLTFAMAVVLVGFEIFVAALQAFIFAILTASYIGGALADEH